MQPAEATQNAQVGEKALGVEEFRGEIRGLSVARRPAFGPSYRCIHSLNAGPRFWLMTTGGSGAGCRNTSNLPYSNDK